MQLLEEAKHESEAVAQQTDVAVSIPILVDPAQQRQPTYPALSWRGIVCRLPPNPNTREIRGVVLQLLVLINFQAWVLVIASLCLQTGIRFIHTECTSMFTFSLALERYAFNFCGIFHSCISFLLQLTILPSRSSTRLVVLRIM
jgi:hypothetical protein